MSNELFGSALAQSERELRDTLDKLRSEEKRYLSGEGLGMDPLEMIRLGNQALDLMQQIETLRASREAAQESANGPMADGATCEMFLRYANQCKRSQADMRSVGTSKLGTTGQAGAFNDCYNVYMNAYRAKCR